MEGNRKTVKMGMATDTGDGYRVQIAPRAVRQLGKLPTAVQERIVRRIDRLAAEPRPRGSIKLEGENELYRIRVGVYRVIYQIQDDELVVTILRAGHRRDIYRD
jgi:mRNA interferase RelE/StbE